jgi:hypothetical protein
MNQYPRRKEVCPLKKSLFSMVWSCSLLIFMLAAAQWLSETGTPLPVLKLTGPLPRFSALQVYMLFSKNDALRQDAARSIAQTLDHYCNPHSAHPPLDAIAQAFSPAPGEKAWVAFAVISPQTAGLLCLLSPQDHQYTLFYYQRFQGLRHMDRATLPSGQDVLRITEIPGPGQAPQSSLWTWDRQEGLAPCNI